MYILTGELLLSAHKNKSAHAFPSFPVKPLPVNRTSCAMVNVKIIAKARRIMCRFVLLKMLVFLSFCRKRRKRIGKKKFGGRDFSKSLPPKKKYILLSDGSACSFAVTTQISRYLPLQTFSPADGAGRHIRASSNQGRPSRAAVPLPVRFPAFLYRAVNPKYAKQADRADACRRNPPDRAILSPHRRF